MDRRSFLRTLGLGTAVAAAAAVAPELVLDPERALWVPGQKTFFLPPAVQGYAGFGKPIPGIWRIAPGDMVEFDRNNSSRRNG